QIPNTIPMIAEKNAEPVTPGMEITTVHPARPAESGHYCKNISTRFIQVCLNRLLRALPHTSMEKTATTRNFPQVLILNRSLNHLLALHRKNFQKTGSALP
ncbi:MAG TPA: hypothetical protein PK358_16225, partial [Spirochaetota bacterium]|nr:hypothetical protein [Spirochaetota bacterium]